MRNVPNIYLSKKALQELGDLAEAWEQTPSQVVRTLIYNLDEFCWLKMVETNASLRSDEEGAATRHQQDREIVKRCAAMIHRILDTDPALPAKRIIIENQACRTEALVSECRVTVMEAS